MDGRSKTDNFSLFRLKFNVASGQHSVGRSYYHVSGGTKSCYANCQAIPSFRFSCRHICPRWSKMKNQTKATPMTDSRSALERTSTLINPTIKSYTVGLPSIQNIFWKLHFMLYNLKSVKNNVQYEQAHH